MTNTTDSELKQLIIEKFDQINQSLTDIKVSVARVEEKVSGIDTRLTSLEARVEKQDGRLWKFVVSISLGFLAILSKIAFFSSSKP